MSGPFAEFSLRLIIAVARHECHQQSLAKAGVDRVLNPFTDAADHAAAQLAHEILSRKEPT